MAKIFKKDEFYTGLPAHAGFTQLAIIRDKQKRYTDAIELCVEAKRQGWADNWDKRIARYQKKVK